MATPKGTANRPNIVFILCDNVGWGDFSCYGGSTPTPRIDKFASEGTASTTTPSSRSVRRHVLRS
jgi:arylsulfatase A-like enzyme